MTYTIVEIPVTSRPQTFRVNLGGNSYACRLMWNKPAQFWVLDIANNIAEPIISGIPLVTGCDLIEQYEYANIRGRLFVMTTMGPPDDIPGFRDLGQRSHLYFLPWEQAWDRPSG